jgi:hypothetical protein
VLRRTIVAAGGPNTSSDKQKALPRHRYEVVFVNSEALEVSIAAQRQQSQSSTTQLSGADSVMAASRLVGGQRPPPTIEGVVSFDAGTTRVTTKLTKRHCGFGLRPVSTLQITCPMNACTFDVASFTSCTVPSQLCYFPSSSEAYEHVTIEVAQMLLLFCALLGDTQQHQIDEVLPAVLDVEDSAEVFEKDCKRLEQFFLERMTS